MCDSGSHTISGRPGVEMEKPKKDLGRTVLCNDINPLDIHKRHIRFLRIFYQQTHCQPGLKGTETGKNEEKVLDFWDSIGRKVLIGLLASKYILPLRKRKVTLSTCLYKPVKNCNEFICAKTNSCWGARSQIF